MSTTTTAPPEEGELVVATITNVKQNGAYADLDEFEGIEGFIFIGEIASGWSKTSVDLSAKVSGSSARSCELEMTALHLNCR